MGRLKFNPENLKVDLKQYYKDTYCAPDYPVMPEIKLEGNGNWGNVGDGFESSGSKKTYTTTNYSSNPVNNPSNNPTNNSGNETPEEIDMANDALHSNDTTVVSQALGAVNGLAASPDNASNVQN